MELRDPYEVNDVGRRRQSVQPRNIQVYSPRREGVQNRDIQVYSLQRSTRNDGVQNHRATARRRRKRVRSQMLVAAALTLVIAGIGCMLLIKGYQALAAEPAPHEIPYKNSAEDKGYKFGR